LRYDGIFLSLEIDMNSRQKKMAEALAALSASERERLERLAALAQVTADELWPDVWRDGFDDVEEGIKADIEADEYFKANEGIDNAEVMAEARRVIAVHGKRKA
jgi:hypothetical protein